MTKIRADRVKRLREERGLSQGQLATYGGMSQSYISDIESGKRPNVGGGKLVGLAKALRTNVDYLLGRTDDPRPSDTRWSDLPEAKRRLIDMLLALDEQHDRYVERFLDSLLDIEEEQTGRHQNGDRGR